MIGVLEKNLIFEFRDESQLEIALSNYADRKGCDTLFICDKGDKIKVVLSNGTFTSMPNLQDETAYLIYGCPNSLDNLPGPGEYLPDVDSRGFKDWELLGVNFIFSSQFRVPKPIDYLA